MFTVITLTVTCAAIDLGALEPQAETYLYRQGEAAATADGAVLFEVIERAHPGRAELRSGMGRSGPPPAEMMSVETKRYGFLATTSVERAPGWSRRSDYAALPDALVLAPGETRTFEVAQELQAGARRHRRTASMRLTHEGCGDYELDGRSHLVHQIRLDAVSSVLDGGRPVEVSRSSVYEISEDLGWWVKVHSHGSAAPPLVLVSAD